MSRTYPALSVAFLVSACSPAAAPESPKTEEVAARVGEPGPAASAAASAEAPKPAPSAAQPQDEKKTPVELPFKGEDPGEGPKLSGERAWRYWPDYSGIGLSDLKEVKGSTAIFYAFGSREETMTIPLSFTAPAAPPKKLVKGDVVLVTVVTSAVCGLVRDIKDTKADVAFLWGGKPSSREFPIDETLRVNGKVEFGAPVLTKTEEGWKMGVVVHTDKTTAWLVPYEFGQDEAKVPLSSLAPIDPSKKRKKGDKVIACDFDLMGCLETTIIGSKDDGLSYEISLPPDYVGPAGEGVKSTTVSVCAVGAAPK